MEDLQMKNGRKKARTADEDRISKLSDDLIHQILSSLDARLAVQTSVLSKRWKHVWTTLPFLSFNEYSKHYEEELRNFIHSKFVNHVFSRRNHKSRILKLDLCRSTYLRLLKRYIKYAISHDVEHLTIKSDRYCSLSLFSSKSLKELKLAMQFESDQVMKSDCWTLPNLTTLVLKSNESHYCRTFVRYYRRRRPKVPESCLICLPALTTLCLDKCELPEFLRLPSLTTLCLKSCMLPKNIWDLPALSTLQLGDMTFPKNMSDYFVALASLRNLAIDFGSSRTGCFVISNSCLVNLKLKLSFYINHIPEEKIVVLAPKLCNFEAIGLFWLSFEGSELENVSIKFWDLSLHDAISWLRKLRKNQAMFEIMLSQLSSAKILSLDLITIQVLSEMPDILVDLDCPFYNLKCLKLPHGCEESSLSSAIRNYLLGGSASVTIVTPMPRIKEHMVGSSAVDAEVRRIKAPGAVASKDCASSSRDNSDLVLWQGHEVNSEFVGLLDLIMKRYPQTFEHLPTKNMKIWTTKLNTLCSIVNAFTKTSMTEVDAEMLGEYRALFTDLQRWGFNLNWLMSHLNHIEQLWFSKTLVQELGALDSRIEDAKSKLQDLQTLRVEKITHSKSSPTIGTSHSVTAGSIGDDLL